MYSSAYVWAKVLSHMEERLSAVTVSAWFDDAKVIELNEEHLILYSPSDLRRDIIRRRCTEYIQDALKEIFNSDAKLVVFGDKELAAYLNRQHKPRKGSGTTENAKEPRQRGKRRWTTSRNLKKPVVKKRECRPVTMKTMPAVPQGHRGYTLMPEFERGADRFGNLWLRWMCVKTSEVSEPWDMDRATRRKVE